jgi:hypothetical protein
MAAEIPEDTTNAAPIPMASTTANINCFIDDLPVPRGEPTPAVENKGVAMSSYLYLAEFGAAKWAQ